MNDMNNFKRTVKRAGKCVCEKAEMLAEAAKLSLQIESHKSRLSAIYEKIGESVVNGSFSPDSNEEKIFRYVDEAKFEKHSIKELCAKRKELCACSKVSCPSCGKETKKGCYCADCGEYVK